MSLCQPGLVKLRQKGLMVQVFYLFCLTQSRLQFYEIIVWRARLPALSCTRLSRVTLEVDISSSRLCNFLNY